ncbi:MAG: CPBP family intramembrane metalloprotease [Pirellulales bacterium]|nr:CPBP family intramembrane metalloprotease [Pirellulales bacterium]
MSSSDTPLRDVPSTADRGEGKRPSGRLGRLVLKELRETLRDRRTIVTLLVMPVLIYPLLAVAFQRFLLTSLSAGEEKSYVIGVDSEMNLQVLARQLRIGEEGLQRDPAEVRKALSAISLVARTDENLERHVVDSTIHLAVIERRTRPEQDQGLRSPRVWKLVYREGSRPSEAALHYVESRLNKVNELGLNEQLQRLHVTASMPAVTMREPIGYSGAPVFSLAALIPLILVLMTVTGAVYPAIDLTAGERERGTLETLIAAPVPRLGLLLAKYVAVLTVAMLTALVNLAAMTITAQSTGLGASLFGGGLSFEVVANVLLLLALFAAFFSAILLAITSVARSFKEAQAYIIPLMLLCLVPGVLCLMPSLEFSGWMAVTPLVNIVMLARDLLEGGVHPGLASAAICSTVLYIGAAIAVAARIFGTDAILYGSQATWTDLLRRPEEPCNVASIATALLGLAIMFPCYFVLANSLARSPELPMNQRLLVAALITIAVFAGIPSGLATIGRVRWSSGLGFARADWGALLAAALLGVSLWPLAHEVFLLSVKLGMASLGDQQREAVEGLLRQFQALPLWFVLATMALVPAVCEELCFRGFLFGSLRTRFSGWATIAMTALLFGVFHEVLSAGRIFPSTLLGLALGFLRLRAHSVVPCMVMHALHNGLLLTIGYHREALASRGWNYNEQAHLPITWLACSVLAIVLALAILWNRTRPRPANTPQPAES